MKISWLLFVIIIAASIGCRSAKKIQTSASTIDTTQNVVVSPQDSLAMYAGDLVHQNIIPFNTFSAKVKVQYEDKSGKQPDVNAFIRMQKDSVIWISIAATFLNIEGYRALITPDSIIVLNKLEKTIELHPFSYIASIASIPLTFDALQRLVAGNILFNQDSITSVNRSPDFIQISTTGNRRSSNIFYTIVTNLLAKQNFHFSQPGDSFSAELLYEDYEKTPWNYFSTTRSIYVPEKQQRILMTFKQYEFNNELSLPFNRPSSYTIK